MVKVASLVALTASFVPTILAIKEIPFAACFSDTEVSKDKYFSIGEKSSADSTLYFRCWADADETNINFSPILTFNSGKNAGFFDYEPGDGGVYRHSFGKGVKGDTRGGAGWGRVTKIHIN